MTVWNPEHFGARKGPTPGNFSPDRQQEQNNRDE